MEKLKKRIWESLVIFLIVCTVGAVIFFAQRAQRMEELDRLRFTEVKEIRIALQQYFDEHGAFPEIIPNIIDTVEPYRYACVRMENRPCADYVLYFNYVYGSEHYGKGDYVANKEVIILVP